MPQAGTCLDRPRVRVESLTEISGALTTYQEDGRKPETRTIEGAALRGTNRGSSCAHSMASARV